MHIQLAKRRVQGTTERCQVGQEKGREEGGGRETELEKKTGTHFLTCSIRNSAARGSPFEFFVLPTKDDIILQQNDPATVVNTRTEYVVDCGIDVGDLVTFKCIGPDNKPMSCQLTSGSSNIQKYAFTPKLLGNAILLRECLKSYQSFHLNQNQIYI